MKKGITIVFVANIINMFFSVITSFILQKYLSIESYGYYKVFQLYVNYLGIAHLGYIDGIYLKYGGKDLNSIDLDELQQSKSTIRNMQILMSIIALIIAIIMKNNIAIILALSCVPINMVSFYKNLYQATGEFKNYSIVLSFLPMMMFVCNIILIFVAKTDNFIIYILVVFFSNLILYFVLEGKSYRMMGRASFFVFNMRMFVENITSGVTLTLGNFASLLITSIDRWCIQAWMPIQQFSFYSFAVSVENLFNVCVSAVTTTLYNHMCKIKDAKKVVKLRSYCSFIGIYLVTISFPIKLIVQFWLSKYVSSIPCLFILIGAHSYYFVIKAIYVNLFKARGEQKHYLKQIIAILLLAFVLNVIAYFVISKSKEAIACASLLTAIVWYILCVVRTRDVDINYCEVILMFGGTIFYLGCGLLINNAIVGCVAYMIGIIILAIGLEKKELLEFLTKIIDYFDPAIKIFRRKKV